MTLTRQTFQLIADVVRENTMPRDREAIPGTGAREQLAYAFARKLSATNQQFDRERFLKACGVED